MQHRETETESAVAEADIPTATAGTRLLAAVWFLVALSTIIFLGVHFSRVP